MEKNTAMGVNPKTWEIESLDALFACARELQPLLRGAIGLSGPLGAGKTEFVRAIAKLYSCDDQVTSPTYVLENIYAGRDEAGEGVEIHHWDLYRLRGGGTPPELFEFSSDAKVMVFVEWPEQCPEIARFLTFQIDIELIEENLRRLTFSQSLHR